MPCEIMPCAHARAAPILVRIIPIGFYKGCRMSRAMSCKQRNVTYIPIYFFKREKKSSSLRYPCVDVLIV